MNRLGTKLLACAVALALPVGIAACGGGGSDEDPADVLRGALTNESSIDSGVVNLSLDGAVDTNEGGGSATLELSGPFTSQGEDELPEFALDGDLSLDVEGVPDLPAGTASLSFSGGLGFADEQIFVNYEDQSYAATQRLNRRLVPLLEGFTETSETATEEDANELIDSLSSLENEGTEDIDGESVIHISSEFDIPRLLEESGLPIDPESLEGLDVTLDFFVAEDDDTVRRVDIGVAVGEVPALSGAGLNSLTFDISAGISDPNSEQDVAAPTDPQPLDELLGQFGTSERDILSVLEGGLIFPGLGGGLAPGGLGLPGGGDSGNGGAGFGGGDPQAQLECLGQAETAEEIEACIE